MQKYNFNLCKVAKQREIINKESLNNQWDDENFNLCKVARQIQNNCHQICRADI
jgi:hypothetical protein